MPGHTYTKIPGAPAISPELAAKPEYWAGYVGRALQRRGQIVGTVQLIRLRPGILTDDASLDEALTELMKEFAQTTDLAHTTVAGIRIITARNVRGTGADAVAWRQGEDLIICWGPSARKLVNEYLAT
jgi:hypothetical protein